MAGEGKTADEFALVDDGACHDVGMVSSGANGFPEAGWKNDFVVDGGVSFGEVAEDGGFFVCFGFAV